jgi:hypothetical protein
MTVVGRNLAKPGGFRTPVARRVGKWAIAVAWTLAALGPLAGAARADGGSGGGGQSGLGGTTTTPTTTTTTSTTPTTTTGTTTTPTTTTTGTTPVSTTPGPPVIAVPRSNPFNGLGMWIWEMSATDRGNIASIIAQAKQYGIRTLLIKSSDGTTMWRQFSRALVTDLHEAGLQVCAWQFVYGLHPVIEANLGRNAVKDGADCLVIDAESAYQGRYAQAGTYIARLRRLIGTRYPVGLAGFPYVDYHLSFPYSVFLGPNGAQYNLPQMYWADIGTSVSAVFSHTYAFNEIYRRPIFPLGQLWGRLSAAAIEEFNTLASDYGAAGVSWWDWQSASLAFFRDISRLGDPPYDFAPTRTAATISRGSKGDLVIWAQEHLYGAGYRVTIDGDFGPSTQNAVDAFQRSRHLAVTGNINGATWNSLDRANPVKITWTQRRGRTVAIVARKGRLAGRTSPATLVESVPSWIDRIPTRDELHGEPGAGRPRSARR